NDLIPESCAEDSNRQCWQSWQFWQFPVFTAKGAKDAKDWDFAAERAEIAEIYKRVLVPISRSAPSVLIRGDVLPFNSGDFWQCWQFRQFLQTPILFFAGKNRRCCSRM